MSVPNVSGLSWPNSKVGRELSALREELDELKSMHDKDTALRGELDELKRITDKETDMIHELALENKNKLQLVVKSMHDKDTAGPPKEGTVVSRSDAVGHLHSMVSFLKRNHLFFKEFNSASLARVVEQDGLSVANLRALHELRQTRKWKHWLHALFEASKGGAPEWKPNDIEQMQTWFYNAVMAELRNERDELLLRAYLDLYEVLPEPSEKTALEKSTRMAWIKKTALETSTRMAWMDAWIKDNHTEPPLPPLPRGL